jgi:hypothetical protein
MPSAVKRSFSAATRDSPLRNAKFSRAEFGGKAHVAAEISQCLGISFAADRSDA